jgi:DHA1 family tetracycline resistance protein-like MFS transporter
MGGLMSKSPRKPALWFAVFVVFIDALGMSIIIPIMPDLLEELSGRPVSETAVIGGFLTAIYAINQFLFGPIIGALSDRFGRKPLILIALAALTVDYILMAMSWAVWVLFVGRFIAGLAGASYTVAAAYIVDISDKSKRSANLGLIGAAFGLGFVIGPAIGGITAELGTRAPLWFAAGLCFIGVTFGLFAMPESLSDENKRSFSLKGANPFSSLRRAFSMRGLQAFLATLFLISLADWTYPAIWAYWGKETFGWGSREIAFTLTTYGVLTALVQGGLIRVVIRYLGEPRTIWFGLFAAIVAFIGFAWAHEGWMVFALIPISALSHVAGAALSGQMTQTVSDSEQGELQGVIGSVQAVTSIISSLGMTWIFFVLASPDASIYFPGGPFLLAAVLTIVALIPLNMGLKAMRDAPSQASG